MHNFSRWNPAYKVAVLYAGSVIGAGFASGQEILQFFISFGKKGLWGIVLASLLFAYLGGVVMAMAVTARTASYMDLYRLILGRTCGKIMDWLSLVMLPGGVVVMLAGGGAVFSEFLGLSRSLGTVFTAAVTAAVVFGGLRGVISANALLVPLKIAAIAVVCLLALVFAQGTEGDPGYCAGGDPGPHWAWSAILYTSYNMVVPAAVLSSLGRTTTCHSGVIGGITGGLVLGVAAGLMVLAGLKFYPGVTGSEVPLLYIAGSFGVSMKAVFGGLIWAAVLTTAMADTHGFASRFADSGSVKYKVTGTGLILLALPLSMLKFSLLVKILYPLFGYAGLILLAALLFVPPLRFVRRKISLIV